MGKRLIDNFSDEELLLKLKHMDTYENLIKSLGYSSGVSPNTRRLVAERFKKMGVDYRDFLKPRNYYANLSVKVPDSEYYTKGTFRGSKLAVRVKKDNKLPYICFGCGNKGKWEGAPLTLQLDHKDGDNTNNCLDNLRWACPNCHTQTETYGFKKRS